MEAGYSYISLFCLEYSFEKYTLVFHLERQFSHQQKDFQNLLTNQKSG